MNGKPPSVVKFDEQTQTMRCIGCYERCEVPYRVVRDPEKFAMMKETMEERHAKCRGEAYGEARSIEELSTFWKRQFAAIEAH